MEFNTPSNRSSSKGAGIVAGIIFIVSGFIINSIAGGMIDEAKASESWPVVPGTVTVSEIISTQAENSEGKLETVYYPNVAAQYTFEGREYTTSSIDMAGHSTTNIRSSVKKKVAAYPVGAVVNVYYDPENPEYGILEPGLPIIFRILSLLPWLAIGVGILVVFRGLLKLLGMAAALGFLIKKKGEQSSNKPVSTPVVPPHPPTPTTPSAVSPSQATADSSSNDSEDNPATKPSDSNEDGFSI
jgi:hypothetical protein